MVSPILFAAVLLADTYTGQADVPHLGTVALPPGEWKLSTFPRDPNVNGTDVYVFEKTGRRLERLTFQGVPVTSELSIGAYIDSIGDNITLGVPTPFSKEKNPHNTTYCGEYSWVKGSHVAASFFYTNDTADVDPWMSHSIVRKIEGRIWVLVHASPHAIVPSTVPDVSSDSRISGDGSDRITK